jgi:hypothetical protein
MVLSRAEATRRYLKQLDLAVAHSAFDSEDRIRAMQEDRQGLGLSKRDSSNNAPVWFSSQRDDRHAVT